MTETHFVPDSSSNTGRRVEGPAVPRPPLHPTARRLFGAAWSACYLGAVQVAAFERHIALPPGAEVDAEIDLDDDGSHALRARLNVSMPGVVTISTQPTRADPSITDVNDHPSVISLTVGALSCHAEDQR